MTRARTPPTPRAPSLADALARAGTEADSQRSFRERALDLLAECVPHDAAFFHALNPRVPLEAGVWRGLDLGVLAQSLAHWDQYAVDLARWRTAALAHEGVAVDTEVFAPSERKRLHYFEHFARPLGIRHCALVHLVVRGRVLSVVALVRTRSAALYTEAETALLRSVAPVLALADAAQQSEPVVAPLASSDLAPRCVDTRLTPRQQDIVSRVALGQTNAQIASALGLSANTIRNQLVLAMERLGAGNRAEVVRLAVLR